MLGTLVDAYFLGYDCIVLEDATGTTSPEGGFENVIYNAGSVSLQTCIPNQNLRMAYLPSQSYGFVTDTHRVIAAAHAAK